MKFAPLLVRSSWVFGRRNPWPLVSALLLTVFTGLLSAQDACTIETVAGGGTTPAGEGGPATEASLGVVRSMSFTPDGAISSPKLPWGPMPCQEIPSFRLSVDEAGGVPVFGSSSRDYRRSRGALALPPLLH